MNTLVLKQWLTRWEGLRYQAYDDKTGHKITGPTMKVLGNPTIGIGFNLRNPGARGIIANLNADYDAIVTGMASLSGPQVDKLFDMTISVAIDGARALFNEFDNFPEDKQMVIVDLVFNLGKFKLSKFTQTVESIQKQNWPAAALNLQDSAWFHQAGTLECERGGADVAVLGGKETPENILETIHV